MKNHIPNEVNYILDTINNNGVEAYIVGGAVRDLLREKTPNDWDISTSATPDKVMKLFKNTIPTGVKYGTVTVVVNDKPFEVTTFRNNEIYTNYRQPDNVNFTNDLKEDLKRRDFTINAIAYNDVSGVLDFYEGKQDIKNKIIRTVGNANTRFSEDALRMLRAIRFSSQLDFTIEEETFLAIINNAHLIANISAERIATEISKILMSPHPERFMLIYKTGLFEHICPQIYSNQDVSIEECLQTALSQVSVASKDLEVRCGILFATVLGQMYSIFDVVPTLTKILKSFNCSNKFIKTVTDLVRFRNYKLDIDKYHIKVLLSEIGQNTLCKLLRFFEAIKQNFDYDAIYKSYKEIIESGEPTVLSDLDINGDDIVALGVQGELVGEILHNLLTHCLKYPKDNTKQKLLELAQKFIADDKNDYCDITDYNDDILDNALDAEYFSETFSAVIEKLIRDNFDEVLQNETDEHKKSCLQNALAEPRTQKIIAELTKNLAEIFNDGNLKEIKAQDLDDKLKKFFDDFPELVDDILNEDN